MLSSSVKPDISIVHAINDRNIWRGCIEEVIFFGEGKLFPRAVLLEIGKRFCGEEREPGNKSRVAYDPPLLLHFHLTFGRIPPGKSGRAPPPPPPLLRPDPFLIVHQSKTSLVCFSFQGSDLWKYKTYSRERREGLHPSRKLVSEQEILELLKNMIFNECC